MYESQKEKRKRILQLISDFEKNHIFRLGKIQFYTGLDYSYTTKYRKKEPLKYFTSSIVLKYSEDEKFQIRYEVYVKKHASWGKYLFKCGYEAFPNNSYWYSGLEAENYHSFYGLPLVYFDRRVTNWSARTGYIWENVVLLQWYGMGSSCNLDIVSNKLKYSVTGPCDVSTDSVGWGVMIGDVKIHQFRKFQPKTRDKKQYIRDLLCFNQLFFDKKYNQMKFLEEFCKVENDKNEDEKEEDDDALKVKRLPTVSIHNLISKQTSILRQIRKTKIIRF